MRLKLIFAVFLLGLVLPSLLLGQTYEDTPQMLVSGGITIPHGGLGDFWGTGPQGRLTIRVPFSEAITGGIQGGIAGPRASDDDSELIEIPIRGMLIFPLAPEASGTPYVAAGAGATFNLFSCKGDETQCYMDSTETFFTYSVTVGYTMRPEAFANTFFDFAVRYEQQIINDCSDYMNLDLEVGIGLAF